MAQRRVAYLAVLATLGVTLVAHSSVQLLRATYGEIPDIAHTVDQPSIEVYASNPLAQILVQSTSTLEREDTFSFWLQEPGDSSNFATNNDELSTDVIVIATSASPVFWEAASGLEPVRIRHLEENLIVEDMDETQGLGTTLAFRISDLTNKSTRPQLNVLSNAPNIHHNGSYRRAVFPSVSPGSFTAVDIRSADSLDDFAIFEVDGEPFYPATLQIRLSVTPFEAFNSSWIQVRANPPPIASPPLQFATGGQLTVDLVYQDIAVVAQTERSNNLATVELGIGTAIAAIPLGALASRRRGAGVLRTASGDETSHRSGERSHGSTETDEASDPSVPGTQTSVQRINGIGPVFAKLLAAGGVRSLEQLADSDGVSVVQRMSRANLKEGLANRVPTVAEVESWIEAASQALRTEQSRQP